MTVDQTAEGSETPNGLGTESPPTDDLRDRISSLENQNRELIGKLGTLVDTLAPKKQVLSPEQLTEIATKNPAAYIAHLVSEQVQGKVGQVEKTIGAASQRTYYDEKANRDFPTLYTDPEFQKLARAEMQEMVNQGEMQPDSPRLLYRAAQIAALKIKPKSAGGQTIPPASVSGEAPRNGTPAKPQSTDDKTFDAYAAAFGIKDKAKMKERWDARKQR